MWWIALYLPQWPLEALGPAAPHGVEEGGRLVCLGPAAVRAGIERGMSVTAARARLPDIRVGPRQPERETQALRPLALAALRFSPQLCMHPEGLLIEVQGSLRLFGGPLNLWRQLVGAVDSFKVCAHFAAAPFPEAAWLLARVRGPLRRGPALGVAQSRQPPAVHPVLDTLPMTGVLQAWQAPAAAHDLLTGLGVATLGALRALPRAGLQRRLGAALLARIDQAYGLAPDPRPFWAPPPAFDERLDLPERTQDAAVLAQALAHLLQALEGWLCAHTQRAQVLALHFLHEVRRREALPDTVHTLRLAAPEHQAGALQRLWDERLRRHPLTAPVVALRLVLQAAVAPQTQDVQQSWALGAPASATAREDPAEIRRALARLLDRLQSRLGAQAVHGLCAEDDHRPERATRWVDVAHQAPAPSRSPPAGPQPLWLLPEPEPLAERQGHPVHEGALLVLRTRAERIEAGWFDGEPVCRDYYVAEGPDQRLRWVFRQGRGDAQSWFLHGWFN
ncbi:MAG: hypothetical protein RIR43_628 [Pseudomonadota bacterium]